MTSSRKFHSWNLSRCCVSPYFCWCGFCEHTFYVCTEYQTPLNSSYQLVHGRKGLLMYFKRNSRWEYRTRIGSQMNAHTQNTQTKKKKRKTSTESHQVCINALNCWFAFGKLIGVWLNTSDWIVHSIDYCMHTIRRSRKTMLRWPQFLMDWDIEAAHLKFEDRQWMIRKSKSCGKWGGYERRECSSSSPLECATKTKNIHKLNFLYLWGMIWWEPKHKARNLRTPIGIFQPESFLKSKFDQMLIHKTGSKIANKIHCIEWENEWENVCSTVWCVGGKCHVDTYIDLNMKKTLALFVGLLACLLVNLFVHSAAMTHFVISDWQIHSIFAGISYNQPNCLSTLKLL